MIVSGDSGRETEGVVDNDSLRHCSNDYMTAQQHKNYILIVIII